MNLVALGVVSLCFVKHGDNYQDQLTIVACTGPLVFAGDCGISCSTGAGHIYLSARPVHGWPGKHLRSFVQLMCSASEAHMKIGHGTSRFAQYALCNFAF